MAQTFRRRHNLMTNSLGATLATAATSITFTSALQEGGSNIATLGTDEYLELTITNEVVYLTAYTAGATTGTIVRAREGTVDPGTTYTSGTAVTNAPSRADWPTAKGSQIVGSGTNQTVEKAVGTDGQVWTADSTADGGVKWSTPSIVTANTQTASYTLVLGDAGLVVEMNNASANTLTVPPNSSVAFPVGTVVEVFQLGAGQCTVTPGSGVTFRSDGAKTKTAAQYATVGLRKRATDEWVLSGDLA